MGISEFTEELPITERASHVVSNARSAAAAAIAGADHRLVVIAGPCSIHDAAAALDYAGKLKPLADRYAGHLIVIMRSYFENAATAMINRVSLGETGPVSL